MPLVIPAVSAPYLLDVLLDGLTPWCHLYVVPVTLTVGTVIGDLVEATWSGYQPQRALGWTTADWEDDRAVTTADPLLWTYGPQPGPAIVYGYYVTDGRTGALLWAESREQGPIALNIAIDQVEVWPRLTLRTCPEPQ